MARLLIVYASTEGQTEKVSLALYNRLTDGGHFVDVYRAGATPPALDPLAYDGILVGGSIHGGRYQTPLVGWIRRHLAALEARPSSLFTVCMRAAVGTEEARREAEGYVTRLVRETDWHPDASALVAGALRYSAYHLVLRWVMRRIVRPDAARLPGTPTDTSRDHEYTDWAAVDAFADAFGRQFASEGAAVPAMAGA
jgi:menaquinone-dependent protoporphyrinogen oxidase